MSVVHHVNGSRLAFYFMQNISKFHGIRYIEKVNYKVFQNQYNFPEKIFQLEILSF